MESAYRVEVRRDGGQGWTVTVTGIEGVGGFSVPELPDVEAKARRHVFGWTGRPVAEVVVDVHVVIPADVEQRFEVAEALVQDAGAEMEKATRRLFDIGCVPEDVRWLIDHRPLALDPLTTTTVTNAEIAGDGLAKHPKATGLRWSDRGFAETIKCRSCVEASRCEYVGLDEVGTYELLYGLVVCDLCDVGHPDIDVPADFSP